MLWGEYLFRLGNDKLDVAGQPPQDRNNGFSLKRGLIENYCEGLIEIAFLLDPREGHPTGHEPVKDKVGIVAKLNAPHLEAWRSWVEGRRVQVGKIKAVCRGEKQSVFVDDIKQVEFPKLELPARIGLKRFERIDDPIAGEMYAGGADGGFKFYKVSVIPHSEGWDLFVKRFPGFFDEIKGEQIERGPEIVDGISGDEREIRWEWFTVFDGYFSPPRLVLKNHSVPAGKEFSFEFGERLDVMYGPL